MDTSIQIGPIVAAIATSGAFSALVTYQLNRSKEQTFFMRKKAEELYLAADEFGREFGKNVVIFQSVLENRLTYNQMLDLEGENAPKKERGGAETMEMISRIYFPHLERELSEMFAARDEYAGLRSQHNVVYKAGKEDGTPWLGRFRGLVRRVSAADKAFKAAIIREARRHASTGLTIPWRVPSVNPQKSK